MLATASMQNYEVSYRSCPMDYRWYLLPRRSTRSSLPESFKAFKEVAKGEVLVSPEWRCGLRIDVMIACVHAIDPGLPWRHFETRSPLLGAEIFSFPAMKRQPDT
jgi:hypothetical protein